MPLTRRHLLSTAAAGAVPLILPSGLRAQGPSRKLAHAAIGISGQGGGDIAALTEEGLLEVVAIAEVDLRNHPAAKKRFPKAVIYQDWRELFQKEAARIDSVNVSVPDHMHAAITLTALSLKKHVYCQKPLTRTIAEARALQEAARGAGVVTQMGNQIHSSSEYRTAAKMVREGVIGKVREVHCWTGARYPQKIRPEGADPIPEGLNWDLWLGGAPERPYRESIYHPFNWRGWQDFGGGAIADFGCHIMDTPVRALGLGAPVSIECLGAEEDWIRTPERFRDSWPAWESFRYEFPGNELTEGPLLPLSWTDGGHPLAASALEAFKERQVPNNGALFIGSEASLVIVHFGGRPYLIPLEKDRALRQQAVPGSPREHYTRFVKACLGGEPTTSHFDYAAPLTEAALLGTIAVRQPGTKLAWDSAAMTFRDNPAAQSLVKQSYRKGWEVAGL